MVVLVNGHDDVKVANRVFSSSCTTGQRGTMDTIYGRNFALKRFTVSQANIEASPGAEAREQLNAIQHALLGFGAKALHGRDLVVERCLLESCNGIHTQFIRHEFDSFWTEAWDAQHFNQAGWCRRVEVNPIIGPASFGDRLGQGASKSLADTFHVVDFPTGDQFAEVLTQAAQETAGVLIRADTEDVCTLKFKEHGHLMQDIGHLVAREKGRP